MIAIGGHSALCSMQEINWQKISSASSGRHKSCRGGSWSNPQPAPTWERPQDPFEVHQGRGRGPFSQVRGPLEGRVFGSNPPPLLPLGLQHINLLHAVGGRELHNRRRLPRIWQANVAKESSSAVY
eukprot:2122910-Pyramimonas_sp.AAC.1